MPDIRPFAATTWEGNAALEVGPYKVFEVLGSGGNGLVYRAIHSETRLEVALKILSPTIAADSTWRARFIREARQLAKIQDPHIVACSDLGEQDGTLYMALELVRGGDAEVLLRRHGGIIPEAMILPIARDAARGLAALHAARMIHRDIKPANLLLTEDGRAKLADLGLVQILDQHRPLTLGGKIVGTPCFMSPEQVEGHVELDHRSDVYSLGGTLIQLLTGKPPFTGSSPWAILNQVMASPLPDPRRMAAGISDGIASVVLKAGALDRDDRYATAEDMAEDLAALIAGLPLIHAPLLASDSRPLPVASVERMPRIILARPPGAGEDPLAERLHADRFQIELISTPEELLVRCTEDPPDLVILDLSDARFLSLDVLRGLRRQREHNTLPILVLTGAHEDITEGAWRAGASQVLVARHMGVEDFIRAVRKTIGMDAGEFVTMPVTRHFSPPDTRSRMQRDNIARVCTHARSQLARLPAAGPQLDALPAALEDLSGILRAAEGPAAELDPGISTILLSVQNLLRELAEMPQHAIPAVVRTMTRAIDVIALRLIKSDAQPVAGRRALVVDDDAVSRLMMANALRVVGVATDAVGDASGALKAVEQRPYDLILSDVMMDGLNGFQFVSRLRQVPGFATVPVIFVTSLADFEQFFRTVPGGACDLIAKPFLLTELGLKALIHLSAPTPTATQLTDPTPTP